MRSGCCVKVAVALWARPYSNGQDDGDRDNDGQVTEKSGFVSGDILLYGLTFDVAYS